MDEIIGCKMFENSAYLATAQGDVYRVYFDNQPYPFIQKLANLRDVSEMRIWINRLVVNNGP